VAIPAVLAYNFFLGFMQSIERELVSFAGAFLNRIQREVAWVPRPEGRGTTATRLQGREEA
jgi:biopolymer transport protein TolQ